jgi:Ion channel
LKSAYRFENWRFLQLTVYLVVFWIFFPLLGEKWLAQILVQLFVLNSILVSASATGESSQLKKLLWIIWGIGMIASLIGLFGVPPEIHTVLIYVENIFRLISLLICIAIILSTVFRSHRITVDAIFGAFVAYLLLAFSFGLVYRMLIFWNPESFKGINNPPRIGDLAYFSLVTIATLGYGDIIPSSHTARMISVFEAVLGQFYVAVIVAVVVGTYISQRFEATVQK